MDPLSKFLKKESSPIQENVSGSFVCQECEEIVQSAFLSYEDKVLSWVCSSGHSSKVDMDV